MKILIVDSNIESGIGSADLVRFFRAPLGLQVQVRRGPQRDLPQDPSAYGGIVLSGSLTRATDSSPWVSDLENFTLKVIQKKIPLLGVCFGHQIIARALGGLEYVGKGKTPEFGWTKLEVQNKSQLFDGLPDRFYSFSSHYDEVKRLPPGSKLLATSELCPVQAFEGLESPFWGIQFHPEKFLEDVQGDYKKQKKQGIFLNPHKGDSLFSPVVGKKIFENFLGVLGK